MKPTLDLLRSLTDEHVVRELMTTRRLTRAELASRTGISKPTISESVRRLSDAGLVRATGEHTSGRGRVGTYYALSDDIGTALVISVAPDGVVAESVAPSGAVITRCERRLHPIARPPEVKRALTTAAGRVVRGQPGPTRLAVVSAADPVDRTSGRLVQLPDAPFLVGDLSPVDILNGMIDGPITVDNDVNWAARAERAEPQSPAGDDFAYLYLGAGVGCSIVTDGEILRGHTGLAGELAHIITVDPNGRSVTFTRLFDELDLRRPETTAVDVDRLTDLIDRNSNATIAPLAAGITAVIAALIAIADPQLVMLGGPWGIQPRLLDAVRQRIAEHPRHVPITPATIIDNAPLAGARHHAHQQLRSRIAALAHPPVTSGRGRLARR